MRPAARARRGRQWSLILSFLAGLVLALVALGTTAAYLGHLLRRWERAFTAVLSVISLAAGIATLRGWAPGTRLKAPRRHARSLGAFGAGVAYSLAAMTTSAGPMTLLLTTSAALGRPAYAATLSLAYAVGRGLPFAVMGVFADQVVSRIEALGRARRMVEAASGILLLAAAGYLGWIAIVMPS